MAIQDVLRRAGPYAWASSGSYPFSFKVFSTSDVTVTVSRNDIESVLTSGYTVTMNADQENQPGGTVVFDSSVATAEKVAITSSVSYTQEMVLTNQGGFYPDILNNNSDRIVAQIQQLNEESSRSIKVGVTSSVSAEQYKAELEDVADSAAASASEAAQAASQAQKLASAAETKSDTALSASQDAVSTANAASAVADKAAADASNAVSTANTASEASTAADAKSDTALSTAQSALTESGKALSDSEKALTTANSASDQAAAAETKSDTALSNSQSALTASTQAAKDSSDALVAANTANENSTAAVADASNALTVAGAASQTAGEAKTDAQSALSTVTALQEELPQDVSSEVSKQLGEELQDTVKSIVTVVAPPIIEEQVDERYAQKEFVSEAVAGEAALRESADTALGSRIDSLATVATTGAYADLTGTPTKVSVFDNDAFYASQSDLKSKLDKTGGEYTGSLKFTGTGVSALEIQNIEAGSHKDIVFKDESGVRTGIIRSEITADGDRIMHLYVVGDDNSLVAELTLKALSDNTGTAVINDKEVLTTANGLPLSGGTMTGNISFQSGVINRPDTAAGLMLSGGINGAWGTIDGAQLLLNGGTRSDSAGCFFLRAGTDTDHRYSLTGYPDGRLTWGGVSILPMVQKSVSGTTPSISVEAGKAYVLSDAITSLTITSLPGSSNYNESSIWFTAGTSAPTITFSSGVSYKVIGELSPKASKSYVMSIMANTAILAERG